MNPYLHYTIKLFLRFAITISLIIIISLLPTIYSYEFSYGRIISIDISISHFFSSIIEYFSQLFKGDFGTYGVSGHFIYERTIERNIFPNILIFYKNTLIIFLGGITLGIISGISAGYLSLLLKNKWRRTVQFFSFFLIAIPDFLIIMLIQLAIIIIYKKTGIKFFSIATTANNSAILLPIITLSIFPFAYIYRTTLHSFENILSNKYILTAYSKGITKHKVIWRHVFKNGLVEVLNNLPSILMLTLSNLFIVEYLFNTYGITMFIFTYYRSFDVLPASILLLWLMIESILLIKEIILKLVIKNKETLHV